MQNLDTIKHSEDENSTLRLELERKIEEVENRFERIVGFETYIAKEIDILEEIIPCIPPIRTYTMYLKEQWHRF
jgi:hypothetical protein